MSTGASTHKFSWLPERNLKESTENFWHSNQDLLHPLEAVATSHGTWTEQFIAFNTQVEISEYYAHDNKTQLQIGILSVIKVTHRF